ncbi:TrbI/VirB10 family protein [Sphingomonas sp.]|jgi:type IV secretion system protein VirB10|uniref:TrbI/VirB10 family protein n=1 Tax=Sphingomonas sp. TaxID=28214 RepID=UPI002E165C86|nr:TrbI/VirB10 family protein [Sphingomonas sp.]
MSDAAPTPELPPKADPETLVLRGHPRRIVRFRRGAIIAIAAASTSAVAGLTWMALQPVSFQASLSADDSTEIANRTPDDALAGAPKSYDDVPKLGPPLPGDLGRPILRRQEQLGASPLQGGADPAFDAVQAERQRLAAEQRAARESGVMLQLGGARETTAPAAARIERSGASAGAPLEGVAPDRGSDPYGQQRKTALVGRSSGEDSINPHALADPVSPWTLHAGSIIAASLITGLNSDLPGLVTAQVTQNVHDSVTGQTVLIPQGSRLIGRYDSVVAFGQSRALVVWQRILLPDGASMRIDNVPATDTQGYAGLADRVDRHTWQLLKGVALSTLLGVGTELSFTGESDLVEAIRESAQQSGARAGDQLVGRNLDIQPTIRVRPGWPLRVVVHKDIVLRPWRMAER